jgi:hypothetical protein
MDATTHLEELGALEGFLQSDRQIETRGARRWPPVASFVSAERAGWRAGMAPAQEDRLTRLKSLVLLPLTMTIATHPRALRLAPPAPMPCRPMTNSSYVEA